MSFPADTQWPPLPATVRGPMSEWSAWFSGDAKSLGDVYGASGLAAGSVRPSVRANGLIPAVSDRVRRFFWGSPESQQSPRTKLHMPLASDIASASADLLFSEELQLEVTGGGADRLEKVLTENAWQSLLPEAGELSAALGGVYLRAGWDKEVADNAIVSILHADQAIPEFRYGRLHAVTFWAVVKENAQNVWRHLERHEPGRVVHTLHLGTRDKLGNPVPLNDSEATASLATMVTEDWIATGYPGLDVVYVPNIRPSRKWRNEPKGKDLGRSDIDGVEPLLDAIDETWTSWMRDIRHGKSRIMAPDYMLEPLGPGQGATLDLDREVYVGLKAMATDGSLAQQITPHQFAIRTQEHHDTIKALMAAAVQGAGYSGQTFGLEGGDATKTATEVSSIERRTSQTREKKTRYWTNGIERFLVALSAIDAAQFNRGSVSEVKVTFPPSSSPTIMETAQTIQMLAAAQAVSAETRVRMAHPDWDDIQIGEEVALIKEEMGSTAPVIGIDPTMLDQPPQDQPPQDEPVDGTQA